MAHPYFDPVRKEAGLEGIEAGLEGSGGASGERR